MRKTIILVTILLISFACSDEKKVQPQLSKVKSLELYLQKLSVDSLKSDTIIFNFLDSLGLKNADYMYYQEKFDTDFEFRLKEMKKFNNILKDSMIHDLLYLHYYNLKN